MQASQQTARAAGRPRGAPRAPPAPAGTRRPARAPRQPLRVCLYASAGVPAQVAEAEVALPRPLPTRVESVADDPTLANPLLRAQRLSTGWFGVITEWEGVLVDSTAEAHARAWLQVAEEMDLPRPLGQVLQRIKGARDEVVIMQLFHWTRNPGQAAKIAARKEEIYDGIMNGAQPAEVPGSRSFLDTLRNFNIPVALATSQPERRVRPAIEKHNLANYFDAVVTAEDSGAPEVEFYYISAAQQLQRPFVRCVVVGDSNRSVEAAHELGMKSVIVTGGQPAWNFSGADLVVRSLGALSFVNMKSLFGNEDLVESQFELEPQPQEEFGLH
ncbi:PYRP2 [Scenedesmus sp. PABB004]|nr:PYRP2 [Scenedesmus sp. PABB004]